MWVLCPCVYYTSRKIVIGRLGRRFCSCILKRGEILVDYILILRKIFRLFFREKYIQYRKIICNFAINGKKIEFKINNSEWRMIERVGSNYFLRISIIDIILFPNTRLFHYQNIHLYCDVHINRDINSQDSSCVRVEILIIREIFA